MANETLGKLRSETISLLKEREADLDVIEAVISALQTEEQYRKMIAVLEKSKHPGREFLIGKTVLIADGDI